MGKDVKERATLQNRHIGSQPELDHQVAAWQQDRHALAVNIHWRLSTDNARIKRKRLSPLQER